MRHQSGIVLGYVFVVFLVCIEPYEGCRSVPGGKGLLLSSLQGKSVPPPGSNPGTNGAFDSATLGGKNFAGVITAGGGLKKHLLLLPSLQWKTVTPPSPNGGTNSAVNSANLGEKNFVGATEKPLKKHLLLPSLQGKQVPPPTPNGGTNSAVDSATLGEKNFVATEKRGSSKNHLLLPSLWKNVSPPKSNPGTNSAVAGAKNFGLPPRKKPTHLLLPSLQWRPVPPPPSTNPGHNRAITVSEQNFSGQQLPAESHKASS